MIAIVLLSHVQGQICWMNLDATKEAVTAHQLQEVRVLPQRMKLSVCQCAFQFPAGFPGQVIMQDVLQNLVCDDHRCKWFSLEPVVGHSQLPVHKANVVAALLPRRRIAETSVLGKSFNHDHCEPLRLTPPP